jgi:methenyltetrahydromethanopterin cyclohydrolase
MTVALGCHVTDTRMHLALAITASFVMSLATIYDQVVELGKNRLLAYVHNPNETDRAYANGINVALMSAVTYPATRSSRP